MPSMRRVDGSLVCPMFRAMSIGILKQEIATLTLDQRRELVGYVVALNRNDRGELMKKLAAKIDDRSPERWTSLEEAERRLAS